MRFNLDSAGNLVSESDKNLEVQDTGVIGNIESFAWLELCINSHQFVDSFTSVLMLEELCPERVRFFGNTFVI